LGVIPIDFTKNSDIKKEEDGGITVIDY